MTGTRLCVEELAKNRIAVGLCTCDRCHGDGIARTSAVLDDDRLAELRGDLLHHGARHDIERASGALRNKRLDLPGRPSLANAAFRTKGKRNRLNRMRRNNFSSDDCPTLQDAA